MTAPCRWTKESTARRRSLVLGLVLALPVLAIGRSAAQPLPPLTLGPPGTSPVTVEHMALMPTSGGSFVDKYTIEARLEGGGTVYFSILHRSFGVARTEFEAKSRYIDPSGKKYRTNDKLAEGAWKESRGARIDLQMANHQLAGTPEEWTITSSGKEMQLELTFRPTDRPWRPGAGRFYLDRTRTGFVDLTILAPRATVSGTIRIGGTERRVNGTGYALRTASNVAPHEAAKRWMLFRTEEGPLSFYVREIRTEEKWGGQTVRCLLVARAGEILFESTDFELVPTEVTRDEQHANRYSLPGALKLRARDGERELTALVKVTRPRSRSDQLADLSFLERTAVAAFAKPVSYTFFASYRLRIADAAQRQDFEGSGILELDHINK